MGRNRAGQGGTIEPLTEWLLAASPSKNQAPYEHFLGLLPGRPQVVITDSDNAIGGAVALSEGSSQKAKPVILVWSGQSICAVANTGENMASTRAGECWPS